MSQLLHCLVVGPILHPLNIFPVVITYIGVVFIPLHIEEIPIGTTHAILLKEGKIAVSGPVESVITTEHVSAVFGLPIQVTYESSRFFARA